MEQKKIKKILLGGGLHNEENNALMQEIEKLKSIIASQETKIAEQAEELTKKEKIKRDVNLYTIMNLQRFFKTDEYKKLMVNPEIFQYDEGITAFDKKLKKNPNYFYKYQKEFIQDWSISQQELVILYYGVGTGKTLIAVNCAEQFIDLNPNSNVYFLCPASLVFVIINNMFKSGIDPTRKNDKGEYIYNFLSYQQLLNSKFNFKENSLLIVDEIHNLRNFRTKGISEKVSARKWKPTDTYSLIGTKLGIALTEAENKFVRSIFMTGTLFVNSPIDIEPIISLGYKKAPMNNFDIEQLELINSSKNRMKTYYSGLLSFYRKPNDTPNFPKVKYIFESIFGEKDEFEDKKGSEDPYFIYSRNEFNNAKAKWIVKFLKSHKNQKTLIYAQFLNKMINLLIVLLKQNKINYEIISGELTPEDKQRITTLYNTDKIKVLIFTLAIKEGISFKETNNFIFTQPYWNYAISEQIIARAIRSDSHKEGNKSQVNVYLLCGFDNDTNKNDAKIFSKYCESIMNNDIKTYEPEVLKTELVKVKTKIGEIEKLVKYTKLDEITSNIKSRDANLYVRMINKQGDINIFEKVLLNEVDRFEKVNNIENNEFIETYNASIIKIEKEKGTLLTLKDKVTLKREMYKDFYDKQINKVNSQIIRFDKDSKYRQNRNPNLQQIASNKKYENKIPMIKKMINEGKTLNKILESFNIPKQEITTFQANFTPSSQVKILINEAGIKNDKRQKIFILEPTAGIGNVISELLQNENKQNYNIDAVEIHNLFYQIGSAQFDSIDNIKYYNIDYLKYYQKYNYDYIIGNPPFNLRTQIDKVAQGIIKSFDVNLFDIHFVARAYNQLNEKGTLSMIISNRFLRDKSIQAFTIFKMYLDILSKTDPSFVKIRQISDFKVDKTITKEMTTNFEMVCITLKKVKFFNFDLDKPPVSVSKDIKKDIKVKLAKEKKITKGKK